MKRYLCDKWHQWTEKLVDQLQWLKDLKETNRLLNESHQCKSDELSEAFDVKHHLDNMVTSKPKAINFF